MTPTPIIFWSDSPSAHSGLSRICRDLVTRLQKEPEFRVAALGHNGVGSRRWTEYHWDWHGAMEPTELPEVWNDFAGDEQGIIFTIHDISRMLEFACPAYTSESRLRRFLDKPPFRRWGYFPVDATGPQDRLTQSSRDTLHRYDRILAYTEWSAGVIERTIGHRPPSLPHGIDLTVFQPRDRRTARRYLLPSLTADDFLVGIVATNQARKDWGLALAVCGLLAMRVPNLRVWIHTDEQVRAWSIPALIADFGLQGRCILTGPMTDEELSYGYSACDVTIAPGSEGWGFPLVESMACGVPAIHGNYGGGAELIPEELLVQPREYRIDGPWNCIRPVYKPEDWVEKILYARDNPNGYLVQSAARFAWNEIWPKWLQWFKEGLA